MFSKQKHVEKELFISRLINIFKIIHTDDIDRLQGNRKFYNVLKYQASIRAPVTKPKIKLFSL